MERQPWERAAGMAGVLAVLLALTGFFVPGLMGSPVHNAPAAEYAAVLLRNERAVVVGSWFLSLAGVSFLCFAGGLGNSLRRAEGELGGLSRVAFAAGALWALLWVLAGDFLGSAAGFAGWLEHPEGAKTAYGLSNLPVGEKAPLLPAILVGATALIVRQTTAFPNWYGRASAVLAPALLVGSGLSVIGLAFPLLPLSMMLFFLWVLATALMLIREEKRGRVEQPIGAAAASK